MKTGALSAGSLRRIGDDIGQAIVDARVFGPDAAHLATFGTEVDGA